MASGKTLELIEETRKQFWRTIRPRETEARDRSLNGKARIKARKAARRVTEEDGE